MQTSPRAPVPDDEERRLATLHEYALLDTPAEPVFDAFAALAARVCAAPIGLIVLVDRDRQWFKANVGLASVRETARSAAFCARTILADDFVEIRDAAGDPRFANNPLVTGEPHVRYYGGVPLTVAGGQTLGTLCVLDRVERELPPDRRDALRAIAAAVVEQFELRRARLRRSDASAPAGDAGGLLSAVLDATPEPTLVAWTAGGERRDATVVYANAASLRLLRARAEDVIGKPFERLGEPSAETALAERLVERPREGDDGPLRHLVYRNDGSTFVSRTTARRLPLGDESETYVAYVLQDVSAGTSRDASLEILNERLTTLTKVARNVFASLDPRALVESLGQGVAELTGGGTATVFARAPDGRFGPTSDLLGTDDVTAVDSDAFLLAAAAQDGALLDPDGRRAAVPILGPSGVISHLIDIRAGDRPFVATDAFAFGLLGQYIAVAVRNAELYGELASRRAAVIELNQVKNDLIAMLAHDFKGPLTTIVGLADVLAEDERFDTESRTLLGMINSSAMRLARLASDTLAQSRLEHNELSLRFDGVDVVALLQDIVRVFSVTRGIDLRAPANVASVRADAARLRQLFENLIGNAIKYSPRGEPVDVIVRETRGGVEVAIRDRGIGIPAADISKLFGRFARGSNARELGIGGTGFGLYLSRTIIEMHGGRIDVETKEGVGSTFRVFVPAVPAPQRTLDRRILLLDSEEDGRSFIAHTLRDEGYAVHVVADEATLLTALDDGRYDAAIVDVDRLASDADALYERIDHRTTLVRLVSTSAADGTVWNAALRKPFLIADLRVLLEAAVAERRRQPRP